MNAANVMYQFSTFSATGVAGYFYLERRISRAYSRVSYLSNVVDKRAFGKFTPLRGALNLTP